MRRVFGSLLACAVLIAAAPVVAQDETPTQRLPRQVLFLPLSTGIAPDADRAPASFAVRRLELPDARLAQWYRLEWWVRLSPSQSVGVAVDYVGLESADLYRYGGGRTEVQWSARAGTIFGRRLGFDAGLTLPTGDASLHPLSAKFPAARGRVRLGVVEIAGARLWAGAWGRLVSPPSDDVREAPLDDFPSGNGVDLTLEGSWSRWAIMASARQPLADLPESASFVLEVDWHWSPALALRVGGMVDVGPRVARSLDHGWTAAVVWKPSLPAPFDPDDEDGADAGS